jgi:3D (Asp-Asp-Asp) domain-containing protein
MRLKTILVLVSVLCLGIAAKAETFSSNFKPLKPIVVAAEDGATLAADLIAQSPTIKTRFARVTAYWPGEDYYTSHKMTATGIRLRQGLCAVDSNIIPYGSLVLIPGIGNFLAMDTGTAVINRKAARLGGHTKTERGAIVVDLYFASRRAGELFMQGGAKFAMIAWDPNGPTSIGLGLASAQ